MSLIQSPLLAYDQKCTTEGPSNYSRLLFKSSWFTPQRAEKDIFASDQIDMSLKRKQGSLKQRKPRTSANSDEPSVKLGSL